MKVLYTGKPQDEYYTPAYAVELINRYIPKGSKILCPFDTEISEFVKVFQDAGHKVHYSHLEHGIDFFSYTKESVKDYDYIISNPPFSLKTKVIAHLELLSKPFAMLLPISQTLETQVRQEIYKRIDLQVLHPNKRIHFYNGLTGEIKKITTFSSGYLCHKVLPKNLVFDDIDTTIKKRGE